LAKKKEPLLVGLQPWDQDSQPGQPSTFVTSHLCPKDKGQDLVPAVPSRDSILHEIFVEKNKTAHPEF